MIIIRQAFSKSLLKWLHQVYLNILYLPRHTYHRWHQFMSARHWCQKGEKLATPWVEDHNYQYEVSECTTPFVSWGG